jgi:hypothetical protein
MDEVHKVSEFRRVKYVEVMCFSLVRMCHGICFNFFTYISNYYKLPYFLNNRLSNKSAVLDEISYRASSL